MDRRTDQITALKIIKPQRAEDHRIKDHRDRRQRGHSDDSEEYILFAQVFLRDDQDAIAVRRAANRNRSAGQKPERQRASDQPGGENSSTQGQDQQRRNSGDGGETGLGHAGKGQPQPQQRHADAQQHLGRNLYPFRRALVGGQKT